MTKTKEYTKCQKTLPLTTEFFFPDKAYKSGFKSQCKDCQRKGSNASRKTPRGKAAYKRWYEDKGRTACKKNRLLWKYSLTLEQHKKMYITQNGCCAVCRKPISYDEIDTDHNHITGKVRKLLCTRCNIFVGFIDKYPELLEPIIKYLEIANV